MKYKLMKKQLSIALTGLSMVFALALGVAPTVYAQAGKGVEIGDAVVISAEVLAIDKEDRISIHARLTKAFAISVETP